MDIIDIKFDIFTLLWNSAQTKIDFEPNSGNSD